eukprot:1377422-Amorphochlora_amoeboformis.AAC.1
MYIHTHENTQILYIYTLHIHRRHTSRSENELYAERDEEAEREGGSGSEDDPEKGGRLEESNEPVPDAHTLDYTDSGEFVFGEY